MSFRAQHLLAAGIIALSAGAFGSAQPIEKPLTGTVIVLDPGHAVKDDQDRIINQGARARHGVYERDVVLSVAEKLKPLLEAQGAKVYMTRTHDNLWRYGNNREADNRARAIFCNTLHAQAYVRLHCDWNRSRKFKGFTTYYYRWESRDLAEHIHNGLAKALPMHQDHGIHRRSFVSVSVRQPAVLLEMGVLSYRREGAELGLE